jgi:hypothetical protein
MNNPLISDVETFRKGIKAAMQEARDENS